MRRFDRGRERKTRCRDILSYSWGFKGTSCVQVASEKNSKSCVEHVRRDAADLAPTASTVPTCPPNQHLLHLSSLSPAKFYTGTRRQALPLTRPDLQRQAARRKHAEYRAQHPANARSIPTNPFQLSVDKFTCVNAVWSTRTSSSQNRVVVTLTNTRTACRNIKYYWWTFSIRFSGLLVDRCFFSCRVPYSPPHGFFPASSPACTLSFRLVKKPCSD